MKMISSKRRKITGKKNPFFSDYFIFSQILTIIYSRTTCIGLSSINPDSLCPSLQNRNKRCRLSSIHCQLFSLQRNSKRLQTRNSTSKIPSPLSKMRSSPIASMYKRKAFKNYCFVKCLEYTRTGPYAFIISFLHLFISLLTRNFESPNSLRIKTIKLAEHGIEESLNLFTAPSHVAAQCLLSRSSPLTLILVNLLQKELSDANPVQHSS